MKKEKVATGSQPLIHVEGTSTGHPTYSTPQTGPQKTPTNDPNIPDPNQESIGSGTIGPQQQQIPPTETVVPTGQGQIVQVAGGGSNTISGTSQSSFEHVGGGVQQSSNVPQANPTNTDNNDEKIKDVEKDVEDDE